MISPLTSSALAGGSIFNAKSATIALPKGSSSFSIHSDTNGCVPGTSDPGRTPSKVTLQPIGAKSSIFSRVNTVGCASPAS